MEPDAPPTQRPAPRDRRRALGLAALAAWAIVVPWLARALGLRLDVSTRLEIADHVLPGLVVLAGCWLLLRPELGGPPGSLRRLAVTGVAFLAALWITATHLPLLPDAVDGLAPWGPALLHLSAGLPATVLALVMLLAGAGR